MSAAPEPSCLPNAIQCRIWYMVYADLDVDVYVCLCTCICICICIYVYVNVYLIYIYIIYTVRARFARKLVIHIIEIYNIQL